MKITFDITTEESDIIAEQFAYNANVNPDKEDFVLEQFKKFGRDCILSKAAQMAYSERKTADEKLIESTRASISF